MFEAFQNPLLSLVYPQECKVCSSEVASRDLGVACADCWASTRIFNGKEMLCGKCGAFFGEDSSPVFVNCRQCDGHEYGRAVALGVYEKALAATIVNLKASPVCPLIVKREIARIVERSAFALPDVIIPIPLSPRRKIERGYNQADVIGGLVSHATGVSMDLFSLVRISHTPVHRVGMDRKARELTVKNAFAVKRPRLIEAKTVLLVDDVFTSGATASACALVLKKSGAASVDIFTLARAVMN